MFVIIGITAIFTISERDFLQELSVQGGVEVKQSWVIYTFAENI